MRVPIPPPSMLLCVLILSGCASFPDLGTGHTAAADAAPWPRIEPLGQVLAEADRLTITPAVAGDLAARAAALKARAARLKQPVVDDATRSRMRAAQGRNSG